MVNCVVIGKGIGDANRIAHIGCMKPHMSRHASDARWSLSMERDIITTSAPRAATSQATACPIPELAPTTTTLCPSRSRSMLMSSYRLLKRVE